MALSDVRAAAARIAGTDLSENAFLMFFFAGLAVRGLLHTWSSRKDALLIAATSLLLFSRLHDRQLALPEPLNA